MPNYQMWSPSSPVISLSVGDLGYSFGAVGSVKVATAANGGLARTIQTIGGLSQCVTALTTQAAHNFLVGQIVALLNTISVGGTNFDGAYVILSLPSTTTAVLIPLDPTRLHQAEDTGGTGTATSLQYETPTAPQAGQQFGIKNLSTQGTDTPFSVDLYFSAAPGTFELDVQVADVEGGDSSYYLASSGNITAVDATNNNAHAVFSTEGAKFARTRLKSLQNAVGIAAIIRR